MKHSTIFKSRWMALLWAAGIIYVAVDVAGGPAPAADNDSNAVMIDGSGQPVSQEDLEAAERAIANI